MPGDVVPDAPLEPSWVEECDCDICPECHEKKGHCWLDWNSSPDCYGCWNRYMFVLDHNGAWEKAWEAANPEPPTDRIIEHANWLDKRFQDFKRELPWPPLP